MDVCAFPLCTDMPANLVCIGPPVAECYVGIHPDPDGVLRLPLCAAHTSLFLGRTTAHVAGQDVPMRILAIG